MELTRIRRKYPHQGDDHEDFISLLEQCDLLREYAELCELAERGANIAFPDSVGGMACTFVRSVIHTAMGSEVLKGVVFNSIIEQFNISELQEMVSEREKINSDADTGLGDLDEQPF